MADLTVDISCTMQCLLIWQSSWHLGNIHCIITHKYIVHKVISARVQWAVLVYKGSCREGEAVSCSVSRSRGGAQRHWRAHNSAQCNSATVQSAGLTTVQSATVQQCRAHNLTAALLPPRLVGAPYNLLFPTGCRCQHSLW